MSSTTTPLLTDSFLASFPDFPAHMNALGQFVFWRTYSRLLPAMGRRETYKEVCCRVTNYNVGLAVTHLREIGYEVDMSKMRTEAELLFTNMFNLRQFASGRSMWVGGTKAGEKSKAANFNCSFLNIRSWYDLGDLFYMLLVGTGVGFKCTKAMAAQMPPIRVNTKLLHSPYKPLDHRERIENTDFHVWANGYAKIFIGDSKEGWVNALRKYFELLTDPKFESVHTIKISYDSVRPHGERLKTFGGQASGPEPLKEMFQGIHDTLTGKLDPSLSPLEPAMVPAFSERSPGDTNTGVRGPAGILPPVPSTKGWARIRPVHILDIGNLIGYNVVVGGVRRCLPAGSLVHTRSGLIPIEEVKVGEEALTTQGYRKITDWFDQGERELIRIITQDGEFICTPNHRMPVLTSFDQYAWVEAGKLEPGQRLISSRTPIEGQKTSLPAWHYDKPQHSTTCKDLTIPELDEDMAWFIGLFHSDGYTYPALSENGYGAYVSISLGLHEMDIAEKAAQQLRRFGPDLTVTVKQRDEDEKDAARPLQEQATGLVLIPARKAGQSVHTGARLASPGAQQRPSRLPGRGYGRRRVGH